LGAEGHGTYVGSITASTDNNWGLAGLGNPTGNTITVHIMRVQPDNGPISGQGILGALSYIDNLNAGSVVVNLSINSKTGPTINTDPSIIKVCADLYNQGSIVYNAAGNAAELDSSAPNNGLVRVASIDKSGSFSSFSNFGPTITAVGVGEYIYVYGPPNSDGSIPYGHADGTSFSAPNLAACNLCIRRVLNGGTAVQADKILWDTATQLNVTFPDKSTGTVYEPNLDAAMKKALGL